LFLLFLVSNVYGYANTNWESFVEAYRHYDGSSSEHIIIREVRLPRAITAALVGSALGLAGAIMQALTRNPMASPGVLGVNSGAGLFVVAVASWMPAASSFMLGWFALLGAAAAAVAVYAIGSAGLEGLTPLKLTLAGATIAALCGSFTASLLIADEKTLESLLFWLAGSVEGRRLEHIGPIVPFLIAGFALSSGLGRSLNVIAVGEDAAQGLGQNTLRVKLIALAAVVLMAGGSVAMAGPIGFVGLVVPHVARRLVGVDYRFVLPCCAVLGAILLTGADIAARFIAFPKDLPVGVMTAMIGAPFFIWLARKEWGRS
jgi:iron complex transport system permease protein